ncbi:MAG TPA: endolytic transglycosylase MltG, partial [Terriglobales bacterium]|nr:endolytic transglycosylase MltG [Terriglobales bacterium]
VTIPEGLTVRQIAAELEEAGFGGSDEYLCAAQDTGLLKEVGAPATGLEGYLFPDTYAFPLHTSPRDILRAMVRRFRDQVATLESHRQDSELGELEMLTLASIIEKETGLAPERAVIAGVFHNRLRVGMRLQSDPTAIYGWKEGPPTAADLKVDNPYNTYIYAGLPPGPICNPGLAAMRAALSPAPTPYFFFVARPDGSHEFSTTLEEHNRAIAAIRRAGG